MTKRTEVLLTAGVMLALGTVASAQTPDLGAAGFSISVGDEVIAGVTPPFLPGNAPVDRTARQLDLSVQFDTLSQVRLLNVLTEDGRTAYAAGEEVLHQAALDSREGRKLLTGRLS